MYTAYIGNVRKGHCSAEPIHARLTASAVGFHTLVVGEVSHAQAPERIRKGLARQPVPVMVLARLTVALEHQGQGLGAGLLKDAIGRTLTPVHRIGATPT